MESPVILISSDSSAPTSPVHEIGSKHTLDCTDKQQPGSATSSDTTTDYYTPINLRTQPKIEDGYHDLCATSSLCEVDSKDTVDRAEVQLSDSDARSDTSMDYYPPVNFVKQPVSKNKSEESDVSANCSAGLLQEAQKEVHQLMDFEDSDKFDLIQKEAMKGMCQFPSVGNVLTEDYSKKERGKQKVKDVETDAEKERRRAERTQNRAMIKNEQARKKAVKMAAAEAHRSKKPGECLKYIQVCLDQQLLTAEYGGEILVSLQSAEMQYNIQSNPVPFSIFWTREVQEHFVGDDMKVHIRSRKEEEEEMLIVWYWDKVMRLIHAGDLINHIQSLQLTLLGKKVTLVIYGAEEYFRHQKTLKRREVQAQIRGKEGKVKTSKKEANFASIPRVSRDEWETALTELHLFADCSHRLVEKPQALGTFIRQFSKAVAEVPFKHEKHKQEQEKLQWYAAGDSRDCVRVDKNGNGLLRLWQQQLCQFNRVGMEAAKAITSIYRSPSALIQAYENCSSEREAELMLEAILIRRGVGPLTTSKKVGPDLSKKVYTFFTALDGKAALS